MFSEEIERCKDDMFELNQETQSKFRAEGACLKRKILVVEKLLEKEEVAPLVEEGKIKFKAKDNRVLFCIPFKQVIYQRAEGEQYR